MSDQSKLTVSKPTVIEIRSETPDEWRDRTGSYQWVDEDAPTLEGRYGRVLRHVQDELYEALPEVNQRLLTAAKNGQAWAIRQVMDRSLGLPMQRVETRQLPSAPVLTEEQKRLFDEYEKWQLEQTRRARLGHNGALQSGGVGQAKEGKPGTPD